MSTQRSNDPNGAPEPDLAIRLCGAVKRYGNITAVDGLDLDVPVGTASGCSRKLID